jgi:signal transduction histidine kinase
MLPVRYDINPYQAVVVQIVILSASTVLGFFGARSLRHRLESMRDANAKLRVEIAQRVRAQDEAQELNRTLEQRVASRTEELKSANDELTAALANLRDSHDVLVNSEKLAALGRLVAGVAHELNTPIGNSLLAASTLVQRNESLNTELGAGNLRRSVLERHIADSNEGSAIVLANLSKAAALIGSFKQFAVDQASSQRRPFELKQVVDELLMAHLPMLKSKPIEVVSEIPAGVALDSYPGPLGQVLGNLISNALLHGYEGYTIGKVIVTVQQHGDQTISIAVQDFGRGIPSEDIGRIFDPFFTTRMGRGGTGLGLGICHKLVTEVLGGEITVQSHLGKGTTFVVSIPRHAPLPKQVEVTAA